MKTNTNSTESKTVSTENSQGTGYSMPIPTPVEDKVDDFGYDIPEVKKEEVKKDEPKPEEPKKDDKIESPSTGYSDVVEEPKKDEPKPEEPKSDEEKKLSDEINEAIKDLPEEINKEKLLKFAQDNKMTIDQVKAYATMVKEELESSKANRVESEKKQRVEWLNELKSDPEFGGENFVKNVDRVEKILESNFPNLKKKLTDSKGMLPPYMMKDLLAIAKELNPTTDFVKGDAGKVEEETSFLDDMYK